MGAGGARKARRCTCDLFLLQHRHSAVRAHGLRQERTVGFEQEGSERFPATDQVLGRNIRKDEEMSKVADSIRRGLEEAVAYARGEAKEGDYKVHVPALIDVRAIRTKLGMTQQEFAGRFGFSVNTLRHWEQGKRQPEGPTRAYLLVIERAPKAVQEALRAA